MYPSHLKGGWLNIIQWFSFHIQSGGTAASVHDGQELPALWRHKRALGA